MLARMCERSCASTPGMAASAPAVAWAGNPPAGVEVAEEESPGTAGFAPGAAADETSLAEPRATTGTRPRRLRDVLDPKQR